MKEINVYPIIMGAFAVVASASALAQSKFEGAYGQVGIGYENISPSFNTGGISAAGLGTVPVSSNLSSQGSFVGTVGVGYTAAITKDFLLGLGVEYSPLNSTSGNFSYSAANIVTIPGTFQKQGSYNVFLSPATPIGEDGLLYLKVGFTGATFKIADTVASLKSDYTGYSLGLGYKHLFSNGFYAFAEVNYANYGKQDLTYSGIGPQGRPYSFPYTNSGSTVNGLVGLGYKF